jgi:hypothetical protein
MGQNNNSIKYVPAQEKYDTSDAKVTLYNLADHLGRLSKSGSGYLSECPACHRNTLHLTPGSNRDKARIWCYYVTGQNHAASLRRQALAMLSSLRENIPLIIIELKRIGIVGGHLIIPTNGHIR